MHKQNKNRNWYQIKAQGHTAEILIYDFIGEDFFGGGVTAKGLIDELNALKDITELNVRINSPGGDVFDGIAIHNALQRHKATVNVHIDGLAASIASIIAMAGDTIIMAENALMMIHNPHGFAIGDAAEMRKTGDLLDKAKESLVNTYESRVGENTSRTEIETMMDEETWFTAQEAVESGFADEIGNAVKIAAHFDLSKLNYHQVPDNLKNQKPIPSEEVTVTVPVKVDVKVTVDDGSQPEPGMSLSAAKQKLKICEMVSKETP